MRARFIRIPFLLGSANCIANGKQILCEREQRSTNRCQHRLKREHPTRTERKSLIEGCGWQGGDGCYSAGRRSYHHPPGPAKQVPKQQTDYPAPSPRNQAAIIFISACNRDANIQTWLGINNNMPGALVVPPSNTCRVILVIRHRQVSTTDRV